LGLAICKLFAVNGHQEMRTGGHENCAVVVTKGARWRPGKLRGSLR
jgi:hypothetical protein